MPKLTPQAIEQAIEDTLLSDLDFEYETDEYWDEEQEAIEQLAQVLRRVDVLEGYPWEDQVPEGWRHRALAKAIVEAQNDPE